MKVALISYPMLFQQVGGLPLQLQYTADALNESGHEARLFDWRSDRFADFDVIHVFAIINGNHRLIDFAKAAGCAVVVSTVLHPPWTRRQGRLAAFLDRVVGRLTAWEVTTSFGQIRTGLDRADAVVALGGAERDMIVEGYGADPQKVHIVPNGIDDGFFAADGGGFRARHELNEGYALTVGEVGPYKNQLAAVKALDGSMPLVILGPCPSRNRPYLEEVLDAGRGTAVYAGTMDNRDPLFASAYAGASVFMLPSRTEVQPIAILEALAAGTPVVLTRNNSLDLDLPEGCCRQVSPDDLEAIGEAAGALAQGKPGVSEACRASVSHLRWSRVTERLVAVYERALVDSACA